MDKSAREIKTERALEELKCLIIDGDIVCGEELKESKLQKQLKLSRAPIRTAITSLVNEGLAVQEGRTCKVIRPSDEELVILFGIRLMLETMVCAGLRRDFHDAPRFAHDKKTWSPQKKGDFRIQLEASIEQLQKSELPPRGDRFAFIQHDLKFHQLLIRHSKYKGMEPQLVRAFYATILSLPMKLLVESYASDICNEHDEIVEALLSDKAGELDAARAMASHLRSAFNRFFPVLQKDVAATLEQTLAIDRDVLRTDSRRSPAAGKNATAKTSKVTKKAR